MTLLARTSASGLILAETSMDQAVLQRALKEIDADYLLWPPDAMSPYWRVLCRVSDWQPAVTVVTWQGPNGEPLPLSSGLIEEVKKWRPEARGRRGPDAETHNERLRVEVQKRRDADVEAIHDDFAAKLERSQTTVRVGGGQGRPSYLRNPHLKGR